MRRGLIEVGYAVGAGLLGGAHNDNDYVWSLMEKLPVLDVSASPLAEAPEHPVVRLFGIEIANIRFEEFCAWVDRRVASGVPAFVVTPNVDHVCRREKDAAFREAYERASLRVADGAPLLWASRLLGRRIVEKLSGSDLTITLSEHAARRGHRIFLLGAAEGVAAEAAQKLEARFPGLRVAGVYSPPLGFEKDAAENEKALEAVRRVRPDIVFVALGSPKQEIWISRNYDKLGAALVLGIGAGIDFAAGRVRRAPVWMQRAGLEWLWRLALEPRRLWRRYLVEDVCFLALLWREYWRTKRQD